MVEHVGSRQHRRLRGQARLAAEARRAAAQPRHRAPARGRRRGGRRSPSATCSRTPRRCTSRGSSSRSSAPGLHTRHVEDFPDDYARTLLEWQHRFESNIERARELGGDERVRVWRIYLRVSRQGFESGFMSVYQVRAVKPVYSGEYVVLTYGYGRHPAAREVRALLSPATRAVRVQPTASRIVRGSSPAPPRSTSVVPEVLCRSRPVAACRGARSPTAACSPPLPSRPSSSRTSWTASTSSPSPPRAPARRSPSPRRSSTCSTRRRASPPRSCSRRRVSSSARSSKRRARWPTPGGLNVAAVYGGVGFDKQIKNARAAHLVVATPGRLEDLLHAPLDLARRRRDPRPRRGRPHARHGLPPGRRPHRRASARATARRCSSRATLDGEVGRIASAYTHDAVQHEHTPAPEHKAEIEHRFRAVDRDTPHRRAGRGAARRRPRPRARLRAHQARRRPARQAPRHRGRARRRDARQQVPEPARARAGRVRLGQGRHARRHRRRRPRHRRRPASRT